MNAFPFCVTRERQRIRHVFDCDCEKGGRDIEKS